MAPMTIVPGVVYCGDRGEGRHVAIEEEQFPAGFFVSEKRTNVDTIKFENHKFLA